MTLFLCLLNNIHYRRRRIQWMQDSKIAKAVTLLNFWWLIRPNYHFFSPRTQKCGRQKLAWWLFFCRNYNFVTDIVFFTRGTSASMPTMTSTSPMSPSSTRTSNVGRWVAAEQLPPVSTLRTSGLFLLSPRQPSAFVGTCPLTPGNCCHLGCQASLSKINWIFLGSISQMGGFDQNDTLPSKMMVSGGKNWWRGNFGSVLDDSPKLDRGSNPRPAEKGNGRSLCADEVQVKSENKARGPEVNDSSFQMFLLSSGMRYRRRTKSENLVI